MQTFAPRAYRWTPWVLAPLIVLAGSALAAETTVHERRLDNGLKILVKPDRRAPIVTSQVWYKVGASHEHDGVTGISHALEHMMFKGTENLAPGEFSRIVAANGGEENAFTGQDYTGYYQNLAADRLEISFRLEAERMRGLTLDPEEFLKELEVVKEERRTRTDDNPQSLTFERFQATAFDVSPYRHPIIGWPGDLEEMTVADLRDWYQRWYAPNNATLVVAGDVDPDAVFALAETYFGPLEAGPIDEPKSRPEPPQLGEKRLVVKAPAREPYLLMGYKAPALTQSTAENDWEPYALEVLASILDGGNSARFERELVRGQEIAASIGASYSAFGRLPGLFILHGVPAKGRTPAELETALRAQIQRVHDEPVSAGELERVRAQLVADKIYERDSLFYQAMVLGQLETVGLGWELADAYVERLAEITAEQVQAVARAYLLDDHLTVGVLDPQPLDGPDAGPTTGVSTGAATGATTGATIGASDAAHTDV